ncbi:MAG: hypothetical protein ACKO0Z_06855 [Betaproteobacteria bacterium]
MITKFKNPHRVIVLTDRDSAALALALDTALRLVNIELDTLAGKIAAAPVGTVEYNTAADATAELVRHRSNLHDLLTSV